MPAELNRRGFLKTTAAATLASSGLAALAQNPQKTKPTADPSKQIWGNLLHLSYNMWWDWDPPGKIRNGSYRPYLRFDRSLWNDLTQRMVDVGMNLVVIDLGDGVKYKSHPEIAVEHAWSTDELRAELARLRKIGLEPVPKLNFSTTHDLWLGPYSRMVSTDKYYAVCRDLIAEVCELFDKPRLFHIGMDEETAQHQRDHLYVVIRQFDLWWHDFLFYVAEVEKGGARAWMWSDYVWEHPELFYKRMPKSVLQSNWYYGTKFTDDEKMVKPYRELGEHGYDQVPTGSNWTSPDNFALTVDFCTRNIPPQHLLGFLQTAWHPTLEKFRDVHEKAIDQVGAVIKKARNN